MQNISVTVRGRISLIFSLCRFAIITSFGQVLPELNYHVETWETEDGLPQNSAKAVIQTRDGYVWTGTFNGLVRFNGRRFTRFTTANTPELEADNINTLHEDAGGRLWIGSSAGLVSFHKGVFKRWTEAPSIDRANIRAISSSPDGTVIVASDRGVWEVNNSLRELHLPQPSWPTRSSLVASDNTGNVWVSHRNSLYILGKNEFELAGSLQRDIASLATSHFGGIWVGLEGGGILRFRKGIPAETVLNTGPTPGVILEAHGVQAWLGTGNDGLFHWTGKFTRLGMEEGLKSPRIMSLWEDREAGIWVGTDGGGLSRLTRKYMTTYGVEAGITFPDIISVAEDPDGRIWAGTFGGGLCVGRNGKWQVYTNSVLTRRDGILALCIAGDGSLWIGRKGQPTVRLKSGKTESIPEMRTRSTRALFEDRQGKMWAGTDEEGVECYDHGTTTLWNTKNGLSDNFVTALAQDAAGDMWVGTAKGLNRIHEGKVQNYGREHGLRALDIESLLLDSEGTLWAGLAGGGLATQINGKFVSITSSSGLFDDVVNLMIEDDAGNLWIGCPTGLYSVTLKSLKQMLKGEIQNIRCTIFGRKDGMRAAGCPGGFQPAIIKARDHRLWVGTEKGLVVFDPEEAIKPSPPPLVHIEDFLVDGAVQKPNDSGRGPASVLVAPGARRLEFRCVAPQFSAPETVQYQYWLEGLEESWDVPTPEPAAHYNRLAPGTYRFHVRAANQQGVWTPNQEILEVVLKPFLWQRGWFQALIFFSVTGIAGGTVWRVHSNRLVRAQERFEQERALTLEKEHSARLELARQEAEDANRAKSEFLAAMSHEIRTPMNAVIGFAELLSETSLDPAQRDYVETLHTSAGLLLSIINDILDFSKIEAGKVSLDFQPVHFEQTISTVIHLLGPKAMQKGLTLTLDYPPDVPQLIHADPARIQQVLLNLIANAIKFTRVGSVKVEVAKVGKQHLRCAVHDTGIGILAQHRTKIFKKFSQADSSTTREFGGTGLGLAISKRLVELMQGTIGFQSEAGHGSTFWFTIPFLPPPVAAGDQP